MVWNVGIILVLLFNLCTYALQGRDCSQGGCSFNIGNFSNDMKNSVGSSQDVKQRLKQNLDYDADAAAQNPESIPDQGAANDINRILQSIQGATDIEFTCTEKRVISVKTLYRCTWNENLFPSMALCNQNCVEEGECQQAPCYGTAYCNALSGGYVCPIGIEQCSATPTCPPEGSYNAQTGKCEAQPI